MSKTKFTPESWIIANSDYFNEATNSHLVVKTENDEWEICHLCDGIEGSIGEIMIANGYLITQAPAMFAELESIAANLPIINKHLPMNVVGIEGMISRINALLSAARGETIKP